MPCFGYFLSSEELSPTAMLRAAQRAETVGIDKVFVSDHFHPWLESQGESPFVWSVLGGIASTTNHHITTGVTCPTVRIHPAILAQAAATMQLLAEGRFRFGVGSGENLNGHILAHRWPPVATRLKMLEEAIGGPPKAPMMLVGEQPGDQEDEVGYPFVGPAGHVLDAALEEAGIDRRTVYVTSAVKHFKWKPRGKKRIHDKPNRTEVAACRPWLDREIELASPDVLVLVGATTAQSILGAKFLLTKRRGEDLTDTGLSPHVVATAHPSAILRMTDAADRAKDRQMLVADLAGAASLIGAK